MAKRPPLKEVKALFKAGIAIAGTVVDVAPAITDFDTSIIEVTDNHFNGGLLIFIDGPNAGQFHLVDVYTGAGGNCAFAVNDRWTDVPVNGNAFLLIPNAGAYLKKIFTAIAAIVADPWAVALPGAYGAGTGGNIVGNNLDAPVSGTAIPGDAMDLLAATIIAIRQSVCAGTDPASSIGKLLNDYLDAAVSSRASTTEVQTTTVAAGAGSNATLTRLGLLVRWITDNVALAATALSTAQWTNALATALGNYTAALASKLNVDSAITAVGKITITAKVFDLAQAGGTVGDLFTATTQDVVVEKLVIRMSGGTLVGSNLTSILIQTDDATPIVLIDIVAGAVANLTNEAQLAWTGAILLDAGTSAKIQITLNGGAATAAKVADIIAECRAVVAGGNLT